MMPVHVPPHAPHTLLESDGEELVLGGRPLSELARQIGRTPFYAYDRDAIARRIASLRAILPHGMRLHYAVKANPLPALVAFVGGLVDGLDVASAGELDIALQAGMAPDRVSIAGPGKTQAELEWAVAARIVVNLESAGEMRRLHEIALAAGTRPAVAVRVNPDFELKASGMKMGGGPRPFGVDAEQVPALLAQLARLNLDFVGFHIFCGSQNLRPDALAEAQHRSVELAARLAAAAPAPARKVNIGGGFGIPYFPGDQPLPAEALADNLQSVAAASAQMLPGAELIIELGRYLVGEAGVYVCRVIDRKVSRGQTFLVTDGGLHHHLAASGNFGQVIRKNFPVVIGNRLQSGSREPVSIVGPLCTPLDLLAERVELPRAEVGDLVAVLQSGAYGYSASPLRFLSHPAPIEVLV